MNTACTLSDREGYIVLHLCSGSKLCRAGEGSKGIFPWPGRPQPPKPEFGVKGDGGMRIEEIRNGMRNIHIEGKIVDMNQFMLVLDDETGRTFVRYNFRNLVKPVQKGDYVKVDNGVAVNYSGILQLKLPRNGLITPTQ